MKTISLCFLSICSLEGSLRAPSKPLGITSFSLEIALDLLENPLHCYKLFFSQKFGFSPQDVKNIQKKLYIYTQNINKDFICAMVYLWRKNCQKNFLKNLRFLKKDYNLYGVFLMLSYDVTGTYEEYLENIGGQYFIGFYNMWKKKQEILQFQSFYKNAKIWSELLIISRFIKKYYLKNKKNTQQFQEDQKNIVGFLQELQRLNNKVLSSSSLLKDWTAVQMKSQTLMNDVISLEKNYPSPISVSLVHEFYAKKDPKKNFFILLSSLANLKNPKDFYPKIKTLHFYR